VNCSNNSILFFPPHVSSLIFSLMQQVQGSFRPFAIHPFEHIASPPNLTSGISAPSIGNANVIVCCRWGGPISVQESQ